MIEAPIGLGPKGHKYWTDITRDFELNMHEAIIAERIARALDLIEHIQNELRLDELITQGSMKQDIANPLLNELRQYNLMVNTLMKQLPISAEEKDQKQLTLSEKRRAASNARWHPTAMKVVS